MIEKKVLREREGGPRQEIVAFTVKFIFFIFLSVISHQEASSFSEHAQIVLPVKGFLEDCYFCYIYFILCFFVISFYNFILVNFVTFTFYFYLFFNQ